MQALRKVKLSLAGLDPYLFNIIACFIPYFEHARTQARTPPPHTHTHTLYIILNHEYTPPNTPTSHHHLPKQQQQQKTKINTRYITK